MGCALRYSRGLIEVFNRVNAVFQNAEPVVARWQVESVLSVGIGRGTQSRVIQLEWKEQPINLMAHNLNR